MKTFIIQQLPNPKLGRKVAIRFSHFLIVFACVVLVPLGSCSGEAKVKELIKDAYAACARQDFEKAHEYLNEINALTSGGANGGTGQFHHCRDKVIREECAFLVAQGDEQSAKRIAFLLLQNRGDICFNYYSIKGEILELAKSVDNQYVLDVLGNMDKDSEQ